jgi:endonuclease YncB( thermonuclease family)
LSQGLARVSKRTSSLLRRLPPAATTMVNELKEAQETARRGRRNMWRYGDIDSDED